MDQPELTRIYDSYGESLFRFMLVMTHNEAESRDLLQDLFIRLARLPDSSAFTNEKSYLFRMCRNLITDLRREEGARRARQERHGLMQSPFAQTQDPDIAHVRSSLENALAQLPDNQRTIMHLKLWQEWTFEEIAELEEISANTAASRYRYAIEKLQAELATLYQEIK